MRDRANQRVPRPVLPGPRVNSDLGGPPAYGESGVFLDVQKYLPASVDSENYGHYEDQKEIDF